MGEKALATDHRGVISSIYDGMLRHKPTILNNISTWSCIFMTSENYLNCFEICKIYQVVISRSDP